MVRKFLLACHRYIGLSLAVLLALIALSGSILAFDPELDALLNPDVFEIDEAGGQALSPSEIADRVEATDARIWVRYIPLPARIEHAIVVYVDSRVDPSTGKSFDAPYDEVFVNPVTGAVLGHRMWGECCERRNFVPFVFKFHNRLLLPSGIGRPIVGVIGILWALTTIVGIYLSLPERGPKVRALLRALLPPRGASGKFTALQLHRASGLWFSVVFLLVALSGVAIALDHQLFRPVVGAFSPVSPTVWEERAAASDSDGGAATITYDDALAVAVQHAQTIGLGATASEISRSDYRGLYRIGFGDRLSAGVGISDVYVDSRTGEVAGDAIAGRGTGGDILNLAVQPLHSGRIIGMTGRIVVFASGIVVSVLIWLGIAIWLRKRRRNIRSR